MMIRRFNDLQYLPAGHEDTANPGVWKKVLFEKMDLSDGRVQMINWARLPVGSSFRAHFHEDMDEVSIIIEGKVRIKVDSEEEMLDRGDGVLVPMKGVHKMTNIGDRDALYFVVGLTREKGGKTVVVE